MLEPSSAWLLSLALGPSFGGEASDAPLPLALAHVVDTGSPLYTMLLGIGLLGLVASFHGIILAAGRATMELGRSGLGPRFLGHVHPSRHTPLWALLTNLGVGVLAILSGRTGDIITLACFGALTLYIASMVSLLVLRRTEPELPRPYRAVLYPVFPVVALVLAALSLVAMTVYNLGIAALFALLMVLGLIWHQLRGRHGLDPSWAHPERT